ncbi:malate dehydrogenase (quinone) [Rubritalea squalenifaciens DSM 18772]|uniref:Probable malate:quinone oxidoreductase n=1 Tax=Rubritalea squalenifaciens DSM 18772 TaxID=1123071 RepID=A0A1M6D8S7_9BACT|nr:malate dehydrogenase (quinone) [Rubritalea squalenifaciens]SHI69540.1 malate dehydrogenase (quinone) [Rubritalea squalenifaciens DSM 18772]
MSSQASKAVNGGLISHPDVILIGGGIMSATLGVMLKKLKPEMTIQIIEALPSVALESSHAWNNAGTGHAALCELNYTPQAADGSINISKAVKINEDFEKSKQFWAYLVEQGVIDEPGDFIRKVPHMSFVNGDDGCDFLRKRHEAMKGHHFFDEMEYSEDPAKISEWAPLLTAGRNGSGKVGVTHVDSGTDIDFGSLTKILINYLKGLDGVSLSTETSVRDLDQQPDGGWKVRVRRDGERSSEKLYAKFVFIGAGGGSLKLLQKSDIPEGKGFGGFPVSGQFLVCDNEELVEKHAAKVYGKAAVGAPPMSVPHLDTRVIDGKKSLLFGPYAGFSPKFLKSGSMFDLLSSVTVDNLGPMLAVGRDNMNLTEYLYQEVVNTHQDRMDMLRDFFPDAKNQEWRLVTAGQRVQIIKKDTEVGGKLQFGTEVVSSSDGSIAALLGASPGASTSVAIILEVLERCFAEEMKGWKDGVKGMVASYGESLAENKERYEEVRGRADKALGIA